MGIGEARVLAGKQIIAGERQLESSGDRGTIHRADDGLGALLQCHNNRRFGSQTQSARQQLRFIGQCLEIHTGTKCAAGTRQYNRAHSLVGREVGEGCNDGLRQCAIEGVMRVGTIQRHQCDASFLMNFDNRHGCTSRIQ